MAAKEGARRIQSALALAQEGFWAACRSAEVSRCSAARDCRARIYGLAGECLASAFPCRIELPQHSGTGMDFSGGLCSLSVMWEMQGSDGPEDMLAFETLHRLRAGATVDPTGASETQVHNRQQVIF